MLFGIIGTMVNSALYLLCVFVAGLVTGHVWAWKFAVAAMGVTYLSHFLASAGGEYMKRAPYFVVASIALGAAAGLLLLF